MHSPIRGVTPWLLVMVTAAVTPWVRVGVADDSAEIRIPLKAALLSAEQVTAQRLQSLRQTGMNAVVLELVGVLDEDRQREKEAAERALGSELELYYWIEVARCPELADAHPEWMASLQGHSQWQRLFDDPPSPKANEVVKNYPWVPILNEEAFAAQRERVKRMLEDRPKPRGVLLNDLQGSPSACGCGNTLCRWTTDYGPIRTATPSGPNAAARFVAAIQQQLPDSSVIPVWTTECEDHDGAPGGACAGVGCFQGICWKAYTAQLDPVARQSDQLGVLLPYRDFGRDLPVYGGRAAWIHHAIGSFQTMPTRHQGKGIAASRLIAVLQGWDASQDQIAEQIRVAESCRVAGYVIAYVTIQQDWKPQILKWK